MTRFFVFLREIGMSKILLKCLPVGNLPYEDEMSAVKMMLKLFENSPYVAALPKCFENDSLKYRTLSGIPGVIFRDRKLIFKSGSEKFKQKMVLLDKAFNNPSFELLEPFQMHAPFLEKYLQIIQRTKPAEAVVNLLGPFTISQLLIEGDGVQILSDKFYRKLIIQAITIKALWTIGLINSVSPQTKPIIILEEPLLYKYGDVRRLDESVTREIIVNLFTKTVQVIKERGALVGIQCFEKCDWQIPIEAGVDIISFDAYNNPNNLAIIADKVNDFLVGGGRINWAIVPVVNEAMVKSLTIDFVYDRFVRTINNLVDAGASERLTYNRSMVSVNGNLDKFPLIFAEKALMLAVQLSKRIPYKS